MNFTFFKFNVRDDSRIPPEVIVKNFPKKSGMEWLAIIAGIVSAVAAVFALQYSRVANQSAKKAVELAEKSYTQSIKTFQFENRPIPSMMLDNFMGVHIRNLGRGPMEDPQISYRVIHRFDEPIVHSVVPFHSLDSDEPWGFRIPYELPKDGFVFVVLVLRSKSLQHDYVRVFHKDMATPTTAIGWYETGGDLFGLNPKPGNHKDQMRAEIELAKNDLTKS